MKTCTVCGKAMDDGYSVCPYCGSTVNEPAQPNDQAQNNPQQPFTPQNPNPQNPNPQYQQNYQAYQQPQTQNPTYTPAPRPQRSAYIAAILGFFGGTLGLYNFYLGNKNKAITQLLVALLGGIITFGLATVAIEIWAIVESMQILTGKINLDGEGYLIKMSF